MAAPEGHHQRAIILRTPTPPLSPAIQKTPSSKSQPQSRQPPLTPNAHLAPSRPFYSHTVTPSFASTSFGASSTTSTTAVPTPIELPPLLAPPPPDPEEPPWEDLTPALLESYGLTALRSKLTRANHLIRTLSSSLSALRTTATHYTLQHKLLLLENSEAAARHQVESDITRREVEVLRLDQSAWSSTNQAALVEENEAYKRRLRKAKRSIREYRDELGEVKEENERLKKRIRDNRQHQHQLEASRSPGGMGQTPSERRVAAATTRRGDGGPTRPPPPPLLRAATTEADTNNEDDGLAALGLLASQVLSQEMVEDDISDHRRHDPRPAIPVPAPAPRKQRKQPHLPSITTTSASSSSRDIKPSLLSPLAFTAPASQKRRHSRSRDSTISASEDEEEEDPEPSKSKRPQRVLAAPHLPRDGRGSPQKKKQKRPVVSTPPPGRFPPGATPASPSRRDRG